MRTLFWELCFKFPINSLPWRQSQQDAKEQDQMTLWEFMMTIAIASKQPVFGLVNTTLEELLECCGYMDAEISDDVIAKAREGLQRATRPRADNYPIAIKLMSGKVSEKMKLSDELEFLAELEGGGSGAYVYDKSSQGGYAKANLIVYPAEFSRLLNLSLEFPEVSFEQLFLLYFYIKSSMSVYYYSKDGETEYGEGARLKRGDILAAIKPIIKNVATYKRCIDILWEGELIEYTLGSRELGDCFALGCNDELLDTIIAEQKGRNHEQYGESHDKANTRE